MLATVWSMAVSVALLGAGHGKTPGYLVPPEPEKVAAVKMKAEPYVAREGDLIFYDEHSLVWTLLFAWAGTGPPLHMGIVVKKPDGDLAVLEAGPDDSIWVRLIDVGPRLHQFHKDFGGTILIRRCKVSLTPQKSAALTRFAALQKGKRYAVLRLFLQATLFRPRGPLGPFLARTDLNRDSWICSELAVAASTVAGLVDPRVVRSNATFPHDVVDNHLYNLASIWSDPWEWKPRLPKKALKSGAGR